MNIGLASIWNLITGGPGGNHIIPAKAPVCDKKSAFYTKPTSVLATKLGQSDFLTIAVPLDYYWRRLYFGAVSLDFDPGVGANFISGFIEFTYQGQVVCSFDYKKYFTPLSFNSGFQTLNMPCRMLWQQALPSGVQNTDTYETAFENGLVCQMNNVDGDVRALIEIAPMPVTVACDAIRFKLDQMTPNAAFGIDNGVFFALGCYSQNLPL